MGMKAGWLSGQVKIAINIFVAILAISIFFGLLEIWARYKYYGGALRERGFCSRGKKYTVKKHTPVRIVCVGGSTTHGGGTVGDNETYPFYLEQGINRKLGSGFAEVLNSGLPGRSTEYHRDFIKDRIGDQELDIIVLHSLYNHFVSFYPHCYNPEVDNIFVEEGRIRTVYHWDRMNPAEIINVFLMEHSYFYTRLREKILKISRKSFSDYYAGKNRFAGAVTEKVVRKADSEEEKSRILASFILRYYNALKDIILVARSRDVDVVLVIPPYPFFSTENVRRNGDARPQLYYTTVFEKAKRTIKRLGKEYNLLVIDADSEFSKRGRKPELFLDNIHLSKEGNYMLADIIVSQIVPHITAWRNR